MTLPLPMKSRLLPDGLSAAQQWTLLEWLHRLGHIETETELSQFLGRMLEHMPSAHMVLALGRLNPQQQIHRLERVFNVSYPLEWMDQYIRLNYDQCDPVLRTPVYSGPQLWSERFSNMQNPAERRFVSEARMAGLGSGICFGAGSDRLRLGCLVSISGHEIAKDHQLVAMLDCLMPHLYQATVRVARLSPMVELSVPLSQRESNIFYWMSHGKTNWEISTILNISERTVKFHVANVIRKLNANNRTHAIVLGMQYGLIPPVVASE